MYSKTTDKAWWKIGHRVMGNPFTPQGEAYCLKCKEWGSARAEARYEGLVYAMKEWCGRCGAVINYAVWDGENTPEKAKEAFEWATATEETKG